MTDNIENVNAIEQRLSGYWRELLGIEVIRSEDHFIGLGGNSLLATMLANRIEEEMGFRPSITDLFNTLADVTAICQTMMAEELHR